MYLYFQKNYEQMQALVEELKTRSEKVKLGKCQDSWEDKAVDPTMLWG